MTVELVAQEWAIPVGTQPAQPIEPSRPVLVRIAPAERDARQRAKQAGARWDPDAVAWSMTYGAVERLGWTDRIVAAP